AIKCRFQCPPAFRYLLPLYRLCYYARTHGDLFHARVFNSFKSMKLLFCVLGMLLSFTTLSTAQTAGGLRFLDVGSDPLSLGLSESKTAVLLGSPSIFANPANLALESSSSLSASHTFWIAGTRNIQASVNFRKNENA